MKNKKNIYFIILIILLILIILTVGIDVTATNKSILGKDVIVHQTIRQPIADLLRLQPISKNLGNQNLAEIGILDVTASPFNADPKGTIDSTQAIQHAVNYAYRNQMVCFFPIGKYKVSDTIDCSKGYYRRLNNKLFPARSYFNFLMGSKQNGKKPLIFLSPHSPGFGTRLKPKHIFKFRASGLIGQDSDGSAWNFNQKLMDIDIEIGSGNPGAIAIQLQGAEGSGVIGSTIKVNGGYIGIDGGSGSGGMHTHNTIIGGFIGMRLLKTQPSCVLLCNTFIDQENAAFVFGGRETLSCVGLKIVTNSNMPVIQCTGQKTIHPNGIMSLVDSRIEYKNPKIKKAIISNKSIYMKDVYIKNAAQAFNGSDGLILNGNNKGWIHINEFAHPIPVKSFTGYPYKFPIYIDGKRTTDDLSKTTLDQVPPQDLCSKHSWGEHFPTWESKGAVNVKDYPYNAIGDGVVDDTQAIQKAIDENDIVFFPKGCFRISKTLLLLENTKLIGIDPYFSVIYAGIEDSQYFDPQNPKPLIQTSSSNCADTVLSMLGLYCPREVPGAYTLKWENSGTSKVRLIRQFLLPLSGLGSTDKLPERSYPLCIITGEGGGKWYFQYTGHSGAEHKDFRSYLIEDTQNPIDFYSAQMCYSKGDAITEIKNSKNITMYGVKGEGETVILSVKNSEFIRIFGYGGNAAPQNGKSPFELVDSNNFIIVNAIDWPRIVPKNILVPAGVGEHPSKWGMIKEIQKKEKLITNPFDRPIVYKRGNPLKIEKEMNIKLLNLRIDYKK